MSASEKYPRIHASQFASEEDAEDARRETNGQKIGNREVIIEFAKAGRKTPREMRDGERGGYAILRVELSLTFKGDGADGHGRDRDQGPARPADAAAAGVPAAIDRDLAHALRAAAVAAAAAAARAATAALAHATAAHAAAH